VVEYGYPHSDNRSSGFAFEMDPYEHSVPLRARSVGLA
jgi:hypothetical protein